MLTTNMVFIVPLWSCQMDTVDRPGHTQNPNVCYLFFVRDYSVKSDCIIAPKMLIIGEN